MLFPVKVQYYKGLTKALKVAAAVIPMPKPTLFSGADSSLELCDAISHLGIKKLLLVTDKVLVEIGLLKDIQARLEKHGIKVTIYDGILPDPTYDQIEKGLALLNKHQCEGILAVGGGSPIDASKAIAARATNNKSLEKMAGLFKLRKAPLPLFVVPTTAGTGSEVTIVSVVSNPETHQKTPIIDPKLVPAMAALDGKLMLGLPPFVTAATGMDALTHAIESYISTNATDETRSYALAATKLIMENLETAVHDGKNLEARQNMAMASYYAGLAFTKAGVGYVHAIAHNFGALYATPHGLANSIVLPHILDYSKSDIISELATLAEASGLKAGRESNNKLAEKLIARIRAMLVSFEIPATLDSLKTEDIPRIAELALDEAHANYPVPKYMDKRTCEALISKMVA
ncbi:alcohol dehydrogenase [Oleiphilus sp. HI0130]|uniref:iron-containing alcohol dehydrogenase n=1 Tax=Oleiphilus sp. HI0079 TaxID=1822254 RepID=UPI0007C24A40|nr:iron-containing alcohol dehydrogenase [Oleiphilus sp. HI0079]KZZ13837.1 alcohol dehydrogenase [Oleiphilus sp. HI0079]KZZ52651.1 alcohol dehydrogenase [Oleiphilus sp. HI0118]KZZ70685.1 alcohol dehydrogenase [Oleiphilus sp. HI0130]KZZ81585.1 alcohol dehydrogenase [Oleiphilus sp. HI0133]